MKTIDLFPCLKEIRNCEIPTGVIIFPNIEIQFAEIADPTTDDAQAKRYDFHMRTHVPIVQDKSAYLIPLIQISGLRYGERDKGIAERVDRLRRSMIERICETARLIQQRYIVDETLRMHSQPTISETIFKVTY